MAHRSKKGVRSRSYPAEWKASPRRASTTITMRLKSLGRSDGCVLFRVQGRGQGSGLSFLSGSCPRRTHFSNPMAWVSTLVCVASTRVSSLNCNIATFASRYLSRRPKGRNPARKTIPIPNQCRPGRGEDLEGTGKNSSTARTITPAATKAVAFRMAPFKYEKAVNQGSKRSP